MNRCVLYWQEEKKPEQGTETAAEKPQAKEEKEKVAKAQDGKKGGGGGGERQTKEGGSEEKKREALPPPEEIVMRVFMHCEGCTRKIRHCLKGFEGNDGWVEDVKTDCKACEVVVKGKKAAEYPMKVVERIQRKTGRKVELLTPLTPPKPEKKEVEKKEDEKPKVEEKKAVPLVIAVVLKVHMHCESCAHEMKRRILKMKGFSSSLLFPSLLDIAAPQPNLNYKLSSVISSLLKFLFSSSSVEVFDPQKRGEYVYKQTGKQAAVAKQEPVEKKTEDEKDRSRGGDAAKSEKKAGGAGRGNADGEKKEDKDGGGEKDGKDGSAPPPPTKVVEPVRNELYQNHPMYHPGGGGYADPPQIFSYENPDACCVM
ncbi:hypothetical protein OPV22_032700 [Ensete ventricosum]|uniref:HMA domain-containing protein n=1 Tax=Ensete ventricosum TaxID=4639 RepID=A0AAV8PL98_ENSVE|nr:hypothetical protein OPV22_032700 [Ensete ventricosum]